MYPADPIAVFLLLFLWTLIFVPFFSIIGWALVELTIEFFRKRPDIEGVHFGLSPLSDIIVRAMKDDVGVRPVAVLPPSPTPRPTAFVPPKEDDEITAAAREGYRPLKSLSDMGPAGETERDHRARKKKK